MPDTTPSLIGFQAFCRSVAGIPTSAMPVDDPGFEIAYTFALEWIPQQLNTMSPLLYTAAVYNWGVSLIVEFQQDVDGSTYFADLRTKFRTDNFVPGVISSASDNGTVEGLTVGTALSNMSIVDLQRATDPFGRRALGILAQCGPLWGLS